MGRECPQQLKCFRKLSQIESLQKIMDRKRLILSQSTHSKTSSCGNRKTTDNARRCKPAPSRQSSMWEDLAREDHWTFLHKGVLVLTNKRYNFTNYYANSYTGKRNTKYETHYHRSSCVSRQIQNLHMCVWNENFFGGREGVKLVKTTGGLFNLNADNLNSQFLRSPMEITCRSLVLIWMLNSKFA